MKRLISLVLLLALVLSLYGCNSDASQKINVPVYFYYCSNPITYNSPDGVICAEIRDAAGYTDNLQELIEFYLKGPVSSEFTSPFPDGADVEQLSLGTTRIQISLNETFTELSGLDLTLACACLAKTIQEAAQVEYVQITFENSSTGKRSVITIGPSNLLFMDNSANSTIPED